LPDERSVRRILRRLPKNAEIRIFSSKLGLLTMEGLLLSPIAEDWLRLMKGESLEFPEAQGIARDALQSLHVGEISQSQWNIEKEELRQRCGLSGFDWNKYIADLEAEIHAAVDGLPASPAERLKLELSAYLRVTDPFIQETERNRICSTHRIKDKTFDRLCQAMRVGESTAAQKPRRISLKEAFTLESEALSWLVPGLLPNKVSALLSGLPGSGKSLLSVDLAWAIVTGGKFLGEQCKKGRVLLINSDQPLNMTVSYLSDRGFDEAEKNLEVIGASGDIAAWTIRDLELLEQWLNDYKPDLVIIDSIRTAVCYPLGLEEKSEQVGHWMKEVERLVTRYGSLVWIHHDNKDTQKNGVARASGSTAIPGNVSVHWRIERTGTDESNPARRFSTPKTRGFEPSTLNIEFKPHSGEWELVGRVGEAEALAAERQSIGEKILKLLSSRPGIGLEGSEIRNVIGTDSAYTVLGRMVARGIISKRKSNTGKGKVYLLPNSEEPSPPRSPQALLGTEAESIDINTLEDTQHLPNTYLTPDLTPPVLNQPVRSENADTATDLATPNTSTQQREEGGVNQTPTPDPADRSTWMPGTKFRSVSQHKSYRKYLGKILTVKSNDQRRHVIEAEETKDGFAYWCIELADLDDSF
jgi:archaellum biogenesis ATPase FlaH